MLGGLLGERGVDRDTNRVPIPAELPRTPPNCPELSELPSSPELLPEVIPLLAPVTTPPTRVRDSRGPSVSSPPSAPLWDGCCPPRLPDPGSLPSQLEKLRGFGESPRHGPARNHRDVFVCFLDASHAGTVTPATPAEPLLIGNPLD